jgi:hypothetical protein
MDNFSMGLIINLLIGKLILENKVLKKKKKLKKLKKKTHPSKTKTIVFTSKEKGINKNLKN